MFITDEQVEAALEYLQSNAVAAAQARANRIYCSEYRKTIKARMMKRHLMEPVGGQEREAYAAPEYVKHLEALRDAVQIDAEHEFKRAAAEATLDAWRTLQATERAMKI